MAILHFRFYWPELFSPKCILLNVLIGIQQRMWVSTALATVSDERFYLSGFPNGIRRESPSDNEKINE